MEVNELELCTTLNSGKLCVYTCYYTVVQNEITAQALINVHPTSDIEMDVAAVYNTVKRVLLAHEQEATMQCVYITCFVQLEPGSENYGLRYYQFK